MARPLRIEYPGAWYHVMNRGRRREEIFHQDGDYEMFLYLLGKCFDLFELEIHAYALMPNHYHLLVRTPRGNLSRAMRHLDGVYTQMWNRRYGHDGAVFRGRYKSILVDADTYVMELVRYIHQNPWKAGLEKGVGESRWTSHGRYLKQQNRPRWLQREFVLRYFGRHEKEAVREMDRFVRQESSQELRHRLNGPNWPAMLGSDHFREGIKEKFLGRDLDKKGLPQLRELARERKVTHLKAAAEKLWGTDPAQWMKIRRGREDMKRRAMIYASRMVLKATAREISEEFGGIGNSAISMQCRCAEEEIRKQKGCYALLKDLEKALRSTVK